MSTCAHALGVGSEGWGPTPISGGSLVIRGAVSRDAPWNVPVHMPWIGEGERALEPVYGRFLGLCCLLLRG